MLGQTVGSDLTYHFEYTMKEAGFEWDTPPDGRAALKEMTIWHSPP